MKCHHSGTVNYSHRSVFHGDNHNKQVGPVTKKWRSIPTFAGGR